MLRQTIGIIDSGIGGIFVLNELNKSIYGKNLIYLGDNKNVPYGNKTEKELFSLAMHSVMQLAEYKPDCIVLGCNTLSVSVRKELEDFAGVPVFGVFPPVEKELYCGRRTLLIATERTCKFYKDINGISLLPQKTLAERIEKFKFKKDYEFYVENLNSFNKYDSIVLGCTHYEFIKDKVQTISLTTPVISGIDNTVKLVKKWLNNEGKTKNVSKNQILFIGSCVKENQKFFSNLQFSK